jgi:hypothetical protein
MPKVKVPRLTNFENTKCTYGYITLCEDCQNRPPRFTKMDRPVVGFPTGSCEVCGVRDA